MLAQILKIENLIFYILAVELLLQLFTQFRTNSLLKKTLKLRTQKKETQKKFKEEVKAGASEIPVVKFEKTKPSVKEGKKQEKTGAMDQKEMAVLQEMMTEFFG